VDASDTLLHFLQAENSTCICASPLPIKHNLLDGGPIAYGEEIPHLQPEKYFLPGTRPGRKYFSLYFPLARKTLRGFFYRLSTTRRWCSV
ncbi:MAG: hypothetical protein IJB59_04220, partial [Oscillospiraceae bacterium]|nr:hypothetical protein [Oscillospiraceae bacterium]